jgi:hypothetical protein
MQMQTKSMGGASSESANHTFPLGSTPTTIEQEPANTTTIEGRKEKRGDNKKRKRDDVIDDIFQMGTKKKMTAQDSAGRAPSSSAPKLSIQFDKGLADVLGAIKEVPKGAAMKEGRKHKKDKS